MIKLKGYIPLTNGSKIISIIKRFKIIFSNIEKNITNHIKSINNFTNIRIRVKTIKNLNRLTKHTNFQQKLTFILKVKMSPLCL
jgi:hypothetical protein